MEGAPPQTVLNTSAMLMNTTNVLRQSLNCFFRRLLNRSDIQVAVDLGANKNSSVYKYARNKTADTYLYVDLDAPASGIARWFTDKQNAAAAKGLAFSQENDEGHVFFMIQEMEAWFLKQPLCIVTWAKAKGYFREHSNEVLPEHPLIKGKDIESIVKPSGKLADIIKHFYVEVKGDGSKGKKVKYHKMKSAPGLLDAIDTDSLVSIDTQLARFKAAF